LLLFLKYSYGNIMKSVYLNELISALIIEKVDNHCYIFQSG